MNVESILPYLSQLSEGGLYFRHDPDSQLLAVIAVHSTRLGPALGGCRMVSYPSLTHAIDDVVRLARGMTYKAAMAGTQLGGGKAVILKPSLPFNREKLLLSFGHFVHQLGGSYVTAVDSGTTQEDMDLVSQMTPHVTCKSPSAGFHLGDPSPFTAEGVMCGIEAAVRFALQRTDLMGLSVALQGLGHVGFTLARLLHERGVKLYVSDLDASRVETAVDLFQATAVDAEAIYEAPADIFAPCALGGILHEKTIERLKCRIVAGGANNQLREEQDAERLRRKGILYAPDYVINSAGLIHAEAQYQVSIGQLQPDKNAEQNALLKLTGIGQSLMQIFERAHDLGISTAMVANHLAEERLNAHPVVPPFPSAPGGFA